MRKPASLPRCFKCQQFGHVQFRCIGKDVCTFCALEHPSRECQEPRGRGEKVKCRNCAGNYRAFYSPKHPIQVARKAEEDRMRNIQESKRQEGISFTDRVRGKMAEKIENQIERKTVDSLEDKIQEILKRLLPEIIRAFRG